MILHVKKINLLFICFSGMQLLAELPTRFNFQDYPELAKFIKVYRCSLDIESLGKEADGKEFFLKGDDIERIINVERMKKVFEKHGLDHLDVAQKCLFKDGDWLKVASLNINRKKHSEKLTLTEIQQLVKFAEETGYRDWARNIGYNQQDKLTLFDTEDNSFLVGRYQEIEGIDLPQHCKALYILNLYPFKSQMDSEAQAWFEKKMNEAINSDEAKAEDTPLPWNTKYDDEKIDFEKVKSEHKELTRVFREVFFDKKGK